MFSLPSISSVSPCCISSSVNVPLLIRHGDADPAINIRFGERLFALVHEPKQFVRFPAAAMKTSTISARWKRLDISSMV